MVFVTPCLDSMLGLSSASLLNRAVGVWFNETTNLWNIFNQDFSPMTPGMSYHVEEHRLGDPTGGQHEKINILSGTTGCWSKIMVMDEDHSPTRLWITQNMSFHLAQPELVLGNRLLRPTVNLLPTGVLYRYKWDTAPEFRMNPPSSDPRFDHAIYNEDLSPIPSGVAYNVHHFG